MSIIPKPNLSRAMSVVGIAVVVLGFYGVFGQTSDGQVRRPNEWTLSAVRLAFNNLRTNGNEFEAARKYREADRCYIEAAIIAQMYNDYENAFLLLKKVLARGQSGTPEWITAAAVHALYSLDKGVEVAADEFSRKAVSRTFDDHSRAYALFSRGSYLYYYGRMDEAIRHFEEAATVASRTDDLLLKTQTTVYFSYSLIREGRPYDALERLNRIATECEASADKKSIVQAYIGLSFVTYHLNERQNAMTFLKKAEELLPPDFEFMDRARISNTLGIIHSDLGDYQAAVAFFHRAISFYDQIDYKAGKATTYTFLAESLALSGDRESSRRAYASALQVSRSLNDLFRIASVLEGLGVLEYQSDNYDEAIRNYLKALNTYRAIGVRIPMAETLLANAYRDKGDLNAARRWYQESILRCRETRDFQQLGEALFQFSKLSAQENRMDEALASIEESVEYTEKLYQNVANSGLRRSFVSTIFDRYELLIELIMKKARRTDDAAEFRRALFIAEKSRARSILEGIGFNEAEFSSDSHELVLREKQILALLGSRAQTLTEQLSSRPVPAEAAALRREISDLENQLETIRTELKLANPDYSVLSRSFDFDLGEFQRNLLDDETILLEFFFGARQSYLWVVRQDGFEVFDLPPRNEIDADIEEIRRLIDQNYMQAGESVAEFQQRTAEAARSFRHLAGSLGTKLFAGLKNGLAAKRVLVVSDSTFGFVPIGALRLPDMDADAVLIDNHEFVQIPSARVLAALFKKSVSVQNRAATVLILSDPVFNRNDERFGEAVIETPPTGRLRAFADWNNLPRLPGSADEADLILNQIGTGGSLHINGFAANRQDFLKLPLSTFSVIHFATHGGVDDGNPALSGIVLSKYDRNGQQVDAVVRLPDVYSLRLEADLVVLSACETGLGRNVRGEGMLSLNNAFLQSGAKTVVSSLWKVEDSATSELMKHFYSALAADRMTSAAALRAAQLKLRGNPRYASPFYWAAFTVSGDYRSVPPLPRGNGQLIYWLTGTVALILAIFLAVRRRYSTSKA